MNLTPDKHKFARYLIAALCGLSVGAHAQDFGGLLRNALNNRTPAQAQGLVNMVIQSVAEVSSGQLRPNAHNPADAEGKVILYRTASCPYCKQAASYMQQKNVPFVERDIGVNPMYREEYKRLGGGRGVPFMVIGNETMTGFSGPEFDRHYANFQQRQAAGGNGAPGVPVTAQPGAYRTPLAEASGNGLPQSGDMLVGKIDGISVYSQPDKSSTRLLSVARSYEMVYMGEERDGLYRVTTAQGEGWVDKLLVRKR